MRAVVHDRYGPPGVLRLADVEQPVPASDEVLVRVRATTVTRTDCAIRSGGFVTRLGYSLVTTRSPFRGLRRPTTPILGSEFAGVVEAVGASVRSFHPGDRVFGVNAGRFGSYAELMCVPESAPIEHMPTDGTFGLWSPLPLRARTPP